MNNPSSYAVKNALTIDIEDWFHILELEHPLPIEKWLEQASHVEKNTLCILDILRRYEVKATFFVLGWVAQHFPDLIREIEGDGHEIATHGYSHQLVSHQTPEEFKRDIDRSLKYLSQATKNPVVGYRAPGFSITRQTFWALDILLELGLKYDASIFPIERNHGGYKHFKDEARWIMTDKGNRIFEVPISCNTFINRKFYLLGGGYFRLTPYWIIKAGIKQLNRQRKSAVIYLHPREFDPLHPRLKMSKKRAFMSYVNLSQTELKFEKVLGNFKWHRIDEIWNYNM